jgi:hypothetical protein
MTADQQLTNIQVKATVSLRCILQCACINPDLLLYLPCQVMPNQPCRGVEVWENGRCGGEKAWDAAFKRWTDDGGKAKDYFGFVMAVNSMRRRTRSQVRHRAGPAV